MKEMRTTKMVEVTDVKFVADDGKEFVGENAERDCRDYERTKDQNRVKKAFDRVDCTNLNLSFAQWLGDYSVYKVKLNSKSDFVAMMDYFNVVEGVYDNYMREPAAYPHTMIVISSDSYVDEYTGNLLDEFQKAIAQLNA